MTSPAAGEPGAGPDWLADAASLGRTLRSAWRQASEGAAQHDGHPPEGTAATCRYCPICQGAALARLVGPDLLDQVAAAASAMADVLREAAAPAGEPAGAPEPPAAEPPAGPASRTERIEIVEG